MSARALHLYRQFHSFEPVDVGSFKRGFRIPRRGYLVGCGLTMFYSSDKLNPETAVDEGEQRYYHEHGAGVSVCLMSSRQGGRRVSIPSAIINARALVRLGRCDGYDYEEPGGELVEARAVEPAPEWYCIPSGDALLVVQDRRNCLAVLWGGGLNVEARGVVG